MKNKWWMVAVLSLAACGEDADPTIAEVGATALSTPVERDAVLALVNDPNTDYELLDGQVGLDRRAARRIVEYRNGFDGVAGTADDEPFLTIEHLDDVPYVGLAALRRLLEYAEANGYLRGVPLSPEDRAKKTLALANDPWIDELKLDHEVGLERRAASNIIAHRNGRDARPGTADDRRFESLAELDAVPYVGQAALARMFDYAFANGY